MESNRAPGDQRPPPRPKTPTDYTPTPAHTVTPADAFHHLLNEEQKTSHVRVHPIARERLKRCGQVPPTTPVSATSVQASSKSKRSVLDTARKSLSLSLDRSKLAIEKTGPVLKTAVSASKNTAVATASRLNKITANAFKSNRKENEKRCELSRSSSLSSSSSTKSLFHRRRLPKLKIPEVGVAVYQALNSPCSTATEDSDKFQFLELSPTSRHLKYEMQDTDHPKDIAAEFHNMLSARRRVRKGKFGSQVMSYCHARPTWKDHWAARASNDNLEDRALLKKLTDALQEQKDHATRLVQKGSNLFPKLQPVSSPGCTLKMHWQHKSEFV
ncbi:hypothetical protein F4678DRAFT_415816 [Xylaria arbuscula]|nr:hypothetical protein F4678DRAFT_415816 [Xylaria arbuscula]